MKNSAFQTPSAGRWVLQLGAAVSAEALAATFQTPSAGRWVLQPPHPRQRDAQQSAVSNPISGEVGAAALRLAAENRRLKHSFKPHQRGGGCCSFAMRSLPLARTRSFQTPSAGRWVLQHQKFTKLDFLRQPVSNPISGEVGAAATCLRTVSGAARLFQTPSAGRWVLQLEVAAGRQSLTVKVSNPISGEVGAAAWVKALRALRGHASFKPHQRGGGCCSEASADLAPDTNWMVSNPISGEVGAAAWLQALGAQVPLAWFQTPSAGRWVLQPGFNFVHLDNCGRFKPHQRGGGCCSVLRQAHGPPRTRGFKPHQRGGGCCSRTVSRISTAPSSRGFKPHQRGGGCCSQPRVSVVQSPRQTSFKPHQRGGGCCS